MKTANCHARGVTKTPKTTINVAAIFVSMAVEKRRALGLIDQKSPRWVEPKIWSCDR
ncbi:hypothetical protein [Methanohalobium evestigatum]|uniref:hypothetical protein n=1 Tax=Methanohalobium evestigatum TaxID=2322 RepID=UPI0012F64E71|nr:hypothetical protein [Methanohalobium evestigatum]